MNPNSVSVRNLSEQDIPSILDYWFRSPREYIESMGVDFSKLGTEEEWRSGLIEKCKTQKKLNALIIVYDGQPIGMHTLNPLVESDYGIFHAHIWDQSARGQGIGFYSYPMACKVFFERFQLRRILFKTPIQNIGAIRVKEKLGIPQVAEEEIEFGIYRKGTKAKVFELHRNNV